jgi:glycosyltransferase involved in cell wall biosynthesis
MVKVLMIGMYNTLGGVERIVYDYVNNMEKDNIIFSFINMYDKIYFQEKLEKIGCKIITIPNVKKNIFKYTIFLLKIFRNEQFNVVHIHMLSAANILPVIVAKIAGCRNIIVHSHNSGTIGVLKNVLHKFNKIVIRFFSIDRFACSQEAGMFMFGKKKRFEIINNAINIDKFVYHEDIRKKIRKELNIAEDMYIIGHVGRFSEQKNHIFLIELFENIQRIKDNVILLLIGSGKNLPYIKNMTSNLAISKKIIFLGTHEDVSSFYSAMDIFIFPSLFEGLGMAGIEAQCAGLPVIASKSISRSMKISDLVTWLDLNDGLEEWTRKILELLMEKQERKDMSEIITNAGYNIAIESKKLKEKYIALKNTI